MIYEIITGTMAKAISLVTQIYFQHRELLQNRDTQMVILRYTTSILVQYGLNSDIVLNSLTKFRSGHSELLWGYTDNVVTVKAKWL